MPEKISPRLPEIGEFVRSSGKLVAIEEIPPPPQPPPVLDYIFEQVSGRAELRLHGERLQKGETFSDFYGLESSVESAKEQAQAYAKRHGISPGSDLEVVAVRVVSYYRARPTPRENFYAREFVNFEYLSSGAERDVPPEVETVVWSSRNPEATAPEPAGRAER